MSLLPRRKPVEIEFSNVSYTVPTGNKNKEKKIILKNVSGNFRSGLLTAIMGPSGAGKTTLMHVVAGYKISNVQGTILNNGRKRDVRQFRKAACYIMQEDHLLPHLTVAEAMTVSANLKLGNNLTPSKKQEVIHEILDTLSLKDCSDTRSSNLSGGQCKRLSIALELVNNPPVMLFDEPTSGLDSQNSFQCIKLLNSLAKEGRTIVCTIHQPSARLFEKFDYLYALSDGHCIYRGAVNELLPFLISIDLHCPSYHNPADFLIEVSATGEHTEKMMQAVATAKCNIVDKVRNNSETQKELVTNGDELPSNGINKEENILFLGDSTHTKSNGDALCSLHIDVDNDDTMTAASASSQIAILLKRNYISIMRDAMLTKLRLISHLVVGLLIGVLYYNIGNEASRVYNNSGFLFCCVLFTVFAGMMPTLLTFPLEMKVFVREHHNCWYSLKWYYIAKTMADIPFQIFYPILYVLIVYFLSNQPYDFNRFCMFTAINVLTSFVAQSLALVIGAAMEIQEATFFAPVVSIPILMFSGFFVTFSTIPVYLRWLSYISYLRYSFEGALLSIYGFGREKLKCSEPYCHFKLPSKFLEAMDLQENNYWIDFWALCAFFVILRLAGYFVLRWKLRQER